VATGDSRSRHRVLLIEDHQPLAEATAEFMQAFGLDVKIASTGCEALEMASAFEPEIVLCDLRLPDMEGTEVAQALRGMPGGTSLVIALYSAMMESLVRARQGPAAAVVDRILPKPITAETLDALVSQLESRASRNRTA